MATTLRQEPTGNSIGVAFITAEPVDSEQSYALRSFENLGNDGLPKALLGGGSGGLSIIHRQLGGRPSRSGGLSNCMVIKGFGHK